MKNDIKQRHEGNEGLGRNGPYSRPGSRWIKATKEGEWLVEFSPSKERGRAVSDLVEKNVAGEDVI